MAVQTVFKRYELKYLLTQAQKETVLRAMQPYMTLDKYGRTTIRNLYYDTDTYLLIRRSMAIKVSRGKGITLEEWGGSAPFFPDNSSTGGVGTHRGCALLWRHVTLLFLNF